MWGTGESDERKADGISKVASQAMVAEQSRPNLSHLG